MFLSLVVRLCVLVVCLGPRPTFDGSFVCWLLIVVLLFLSCSALVIVSLSFLAVLHGLPCQLVSLMFSFLNGHCPLVFVELWVLACPLCSFSGVPFSVFSLFLLGFLFVEPWVLAGGS